MSQQHGDSRSDGYRRVRRAIRAAAACILLLPLVAMQFTNEVAWTVSDFVIMGALLAGGCAAFEVAARVPAGPGYRPAAAIAIIATLLLIIANGAVGIVGDEGNAVNLLYYAVAATGVAGALIARFRPRGMALTTTAMAVVQLLILSFVLAGTLSVSLPDALEAVAINGVFIALFAGSAWLFHRASKAGTDWRPS